MPIYVYKCENCGATPEHLSLRTGDLLKQCPECGSKKVKRSLTTSAVHFKGSGWASDGYGSRQLPPDRGAKEARLRREIREKAADQQAANDKKAAEHGLVRTTPTQEVNIYPGTIVE